MIIGGKLLMLISFKIILNFSSNYLKSVQRILNFLKLHLTMQKFTKIKSLTNEGLKYI